ncbi:unnamed protein product [Discosporangium mesarthrocarpum]
MGMVLPIESSMHNRGHFMPILVLVMIIYTTLCVCSGILGYLAFGDRTEDIVLMNMGSSIYSKVVRISFCIGLYFTFPIMMVPVWEVAELKWLHPKGPSFSRDRNVLRAVAVCSTGVLACIIPKFGLFISLIGSSCCALLAFILPTLCYMRLGAPGGNSGAVMAAFHGLLLLGGVFAMVYGTADTLRKFFSGETLDEGG